MNADLYRTTQRSRGALALARTGKSQTDIAAIAEVSHVAAGKWLNGTTKPVPAKRDILHEKLGIAPTLWDEYPEEKPKKTAAPTAAAKREPGDVMSKAGELESMVHDLLEEVRNDARSTPLERAKVMASAAQTLGLIAKLTGQFDLGSRVMQTPIWSAIKRALKTALESHPDAAAAVARELRKLEAEQTR